MTATEPSTRRPRRLARRLLYASAGVLVVTAGAIVWVLGPGGPFLVSHLAEGRAIWRLGDLHLEGVKGAALGDLKVARLTLRDEDGVWAEATDITLGWEPLKILTREASVRKVSAATLHVFRQPKLTAAKPPGESIDVDLNSLRVERIVIDAPVFGEAASFSLTAGLAARGARIDRAMVDLRRLDAAGDTLRLDLLRKDAITLDAEINGPKDGFFAAALKSDDPLRVVAKANGDEAQGAGDIDATIGGRTFIDGVFAWKPEGWSGGADLRLDLAPAFADITARTGGAIRLDAEGRRGARTTFNVTAKAQDATVIARGALGDDWRPQGATQLSASATRLDRLTQNIVRGGASFEGALESTRDAQSLSGALDGAQITLAGVRTNAKGPVRLRATRELLDIETDLALSETRGGGDIVTRLARDGKLTLRSRYNRQDSRFTVREARLQSGVLDVQGEGVLGDGARGLRGTWHTARLDAFDPRVRGEANGSWTARGGGKTPIVIVADAKTRRFSTTIQPLDQLLGASPQLAANLAIRGGVIEVRRAVVNAPKLRAAAFGRIQNGDGVFSLEASAQGPVSIGGARFDGVADATGSITGRLENPAIAATAHLSQIDVAGLAVERPVVTFNFAPSARGREGAVKIEGVASGQPAVATADLRATNDAFTLANLNIRAAGLTATGEATFTDAGPTADVAINGPVSVIAAPMTGRLRGDVSLRPGGNGEAVLAANAHIANGRIGDLSFTRLDARATGPLDALSLNASIDGSAAGSAVKLDLAGAMTRDRDATTLRVEGGGSVNGSQVQTRAPVLVTLTPNATRASGDIRIGEGVLRATLVDERGRLAFDATVENAPIKPVLAMVGERASGTASGEVHLTGGDKSLDGTLDLAVTDALLARRVRDPLTMNVKGRIGGGQMTLAAQATSRNGLDAAFDARAPVDARARPMRIALAGEGRATWRAKGPADALWGIVGALDQNVTGQVEGAGDMRFAVGRLSGEGGFTLTGGAFSDKQTGVELRDIVARVSFDQAGARLDEFSARDQRNGAITGVGVARGLKDGEVNITTRSIRLLNRPDVKAVASGPLSLKWTPEGVTLSGDINVEEATLATPRTDHGIPQLDVIEVNRPGEADQTDAEREEDDIVRALLDVRVKAPGRVFVRDRGLDSEWSLDLRVTGTSTNPRVFGEARLVRGRFTLAGRVFDAESGLIRFNGAPEEALINLAAEMSSPEITARIVLSGPVSDPAIELSSTPALPQDEILPQALFGRASEDLSALEAAQLAASLAQLAGQASLDLAGAARDLVGLDRLDVRETGTGLRVAGGKYLTRDVYLEVARTGVGETETQVEWRVRPQLFLISAFDPKGDRRLSVRWRREY